jgi:hypothetical protein
MPTAKDRQTTVESNEKQAILGRVVRLLGWPVRSSAMIRGQAVKMVATGEFGLHPTKPSVHTTGLSGYQRNSYSAETRVP